MTAKKKQLPDMAGWPNDKIAKFWETHNAADYEDELEEVELEVEAPIMEQVTFRLNHDDVEAIKDIAKDVGVGHTTLVRMWVKEKLKTTKAN